MNEVIYQPSEIVTFMAVGIVFFSFLVGFIIYFMFMYRQKQLLFLEEEKRLKAEYEKGLAESQVEIQDDVLRHVSSEIHDNLGQIASLIKIHLHTFPPQESESGKVKLDESKELLSKLIKDLKSLSISLNTDYISENGLAFALENEAKRINQTRIIGVHITVPDYRINLEHGKEIFMFRMGQEILNNMLKHAKGSEIHITVEVNDNILTTCYRDNGNGFDVAKTLADGIKNQQSGLTNLKKRCALIHADLKITSEINKGSEFIITLPL